MQRECVVTGLNVEKRKLKLISHFVEQINEYQLKIV